MKIAIDPGHNCQPDIGAEYHDILTVLREDDVVLEVAKELKAIAEADGHEVVWCLPKKAVSVSDSLRQRCDLANKAGADLYVSLHCNAAGETEEPRGAEVYAISWKGGAVARGILSKLAELGWKNRGVKSQLDGGLAPYVLRNTIATAVLVELCFLDSLADRLVLARYSTKEIAAAVYAGIAPGKKVLTVEDAIVKWPGSTNGAKGLSDQVIKLVGLGNLQLVKTSNFNPLATCDPYFQPAAAKSLLKVLGENQSLGLTCNSAYRSIVRQVMLYECSQRKIGGIDLAAVPGTGDHEKGLAIDVDNWQQWKQILIDAGWIWQGDRDPVHFYYPDGDLDLPARSIAAFQALSNKFGNVGTLEVDGNFGAKTRLAMLSAPAAGW